MRHVYALAVVCCASFVLLVADAARAADKVGYAAGNVFLEIGGDRQLAHSAEGGNAIGVLAVKPDAGGTDKSIGDIKYDDIVVTLPVMNLPAAIRDALAGKGKPLSGALEFTDHQYKVRRRLTFQNASVSSVRFSALDAASKDTASVEVVLTPESTQQEAGSGEAKGATGSKQQKQILGSNFRVQVPDTDSNKVNAVSAIQISTKPDAPVGTQRSPTKEDGAYDISNIKVTLPLADVKKWQGWLEAALPERGNKHERTLKLELLDQARSKALVTVDLGGVGILAVRPRRAQAHADGVERVEVELYAEKWNFVFDTGGDAAKTASAAESDPAAKTEAAAEAAPVARKKRAAVVEPAPAELATEAAPVATDKPVRRAR